MGQSLSIGCNKSLLSLKLDYNPSLGSEGTAALCRGLRTNSTLKQLHLPYCNLDSDAGAPLGEMLSYTKLQLAVLNLQVNPWFFVLVLAFEVAPLAPRSFWGLLTPAVLRRHA